MKRPTNSQPPQPPQVNNGAVEKRTSTLPVLPWMQPDFTPAEATAFRALFQGGADAYQQGLVAEYLMWCTRHNTQPIVPDSIGGTGLSHDAMLHIIGQQSIGHWIAKMVQWRPKSSAVNDEHGIGSA